VSVLQGLAAGDYDRWLVERRTAGDVRPSPRYTARAAVLHTVYSTSRIAANVLLRRCFFP